ncbi:MAG: hypothetical protein ABEJ98_03225 [Candidatus Nanohaloarchaea archaeon]
MKPDLNRDEKYNPVIETIKKLLSSNEEEIKIQRDSAVKLLRERKSSEIYQAREEKEELEERTEKLMHEIDEALEQVKEYEDEKDLKVVEDVAENFYSSRKKMLEDFEQPGGFSEHVEAVEDFISEFNDVSRKEGEVMKRVKRRAGKIPEAMNRLEEHAEELREFHENRYTLLEAEDRLENLLQEISELKQELDKSDGKTEEIEQKKQEKEAKEKEIEKLKQTDRWNEMGELEQQIGMKQEKIDETRKKLSRSVSRMERGLKKLLYRIENSETGFEARKEDLEKLKQHEFRATEELEKSVSKAAEKLSEEDILDEKEGQKFRKAVEDTDFKNLTRKLDRLREELEDKKQQLEEKKVQEEMEDLEKEKKSIETELEDLRDRKEEIKSLKQKKRRQVRQKTERMQEILNETLDADVEIGSEE